MLIGNATDNICVKNSFSCKISQVERKKDIFSLFFWHIFSLFGVIFFIFGCTIEEPKILGFFFTNNRYCNFCVISVLILLNCVCISSCSIPLLTLGQSVGVCHFRISEEWLWPPWPWIWPSWPPWPWTLINPTTLITLTLNLTLTRTDLRGQNTFAPLNYNVLF